MGCGTLRFYDVRELEYDKTRVRQRLWLSRGSLRSILINMIKMRKILTRERRMLSRIIIKNGYYNKATRRTGKCGKSYWFL